MRTSIPILLFCSCMPVLALNCMAQGTPSTTQEQKPPGLKVEVKEIPNFWQPIAAAAQPTPDDIIVFDAVGDTMLGSTFPDTSGGGLAPEDGAHLLDEVAP